MDKNREEAARAILLVNNDIVTIKRTKYNGDSEYVYYTLPGGHVEKGETFEETVIREVEEELGIKVKIEEEFMSIYNEDIDKYEKFYLCEYVSGDIGTGTGPEFINIDLKKYGKYEIEYIPTNKINEYNLLPKNVKLELSKKFN